MEILEKLKQLSDNLILLETIKEELNGHLPTKRTEWEVRYGLFESIQIIIDIALCYSTRILYHDDILLDLDDRFDRSV